jgi:hypothetical protein
MTRAGHTLPYRSSSHDPSRDRLYHGRDLRAESLQSELSGEALTQKGATITEKIPGV